MSTRARLRFKRNSGYKDFFNKQDGGITLSNNSLGQGVFQFIKSSPIDNIDSLYDVLSVTETKEKVNFKEDGVKLLGEVFKKKERIYISKDDVTDYLYSYTLDFSNKVLVIAYARNKIEISFSDIKKMSNIEFYYKVNKYLFKSEIDRLLGKWHNEKNEGVKKIIQSEIENYKKMIEKIEISVNVKIK